jgi:soluble lytic murein transglycosylase-like protein
VRRSAILLSGWIAAIGLCGCASSPQSRRTRIPRSAIEQIVDEAAVRHSVSRSLILGVIQVESSFNPQARSHVGARGLMQLMPKTAASLARRLGREDDYEITDARFNVEAGTLYLAYLLRTFAGDEALALAAYNTGPARVKRWQRAGKSLPVYSQRYVAAVRKARRRFAAGDAVPQLKEQMDRAGLRRLLQQKLYGDRPDEALPPPELAPRNTLGG